MPNEYRQRFRDYWSEFYREDYLFRSGRKSGRRKSQILKEHSDLFRLSAIEELQAKFDGTAESRETDRRSLARLIAFAVEGYLALRVAELDREIEESENTAGIGWDGLLITLKQAEELTASEPHPDRRRELWSRQSDWISQTQDLRRERDENLTSAARELGFDTLLALRGKSSGVDYEKLVAQASEVLAKTESAYASALTSLINRQLGFSLGEAVQADLGWLHRLTQFDRFFSAHRLLEIYRELFAGLGFNIERQRNLRLETEALPGKQTQPFCSPILVPDEVNLSALPIGGQQYYREFLRVAGGAQNYAWTSRNLYPELCLNGDDALTQTWGALLENLILDEHWLMGVFGFVDSAQFRRALNCFKLLAVRRQFGRLSYEVELSSGRLGGHPGLRYAQLLTEAVLVRFDEQAQAADPIKSIDSANFLRACAFESQLREYLKSKFGERWWTSRNAGDMLIDLWNTGQRYTVEEMAAMIGLGELDFDWLTSELLKQI